MRAAERRWGWKRTRDTTVGPPPRARDDSEHELGFSPQPAVRWLAPRVLIGTGIKVLLASIFGAYADKRELQGTLPAKVHRHDDGDEIWFDYVADLGDGFDAGYSVATLLARESLILPGVDEPLPRGNLLVMGGDEVYPDPSIRGYEDRTKGVYRAAFPAVDGEQPSLYALPGNHDWYDGLTAFLRIFAQGRSFGGWTTEQTRSYFAIQLPRRWWLFAVDTQFDDYLDTPQLSYFRDAARDVKPGDGVILCTPNPVWIDAEAPGGAPAYDIVEFFEREIIRPTGAEVRLMLAGDKHHYSRYQRAEGGRQHITCGLGGAYLTATHELPDRVDLPPPESRLRNSAPRVRYDRVTRYPRKLASEVLTAGIFQLPWRNPGFWMMAGISQSLVTLAVLFGLHGPFGDDGDFFTSVATWTPAVVLGAAMVVVALVFARLNPRTPRVHANIAGSLHAAAHLGLSTGWAYTIRWMYTGVLPEGWFTDWFTLLLAVVGTPVLIGLLHAELVALYLMVVSRFGINLNEVMAGQSIEDHKGFLRLHIDPDGALTVYPVMLPKVCRAWVADPDGAPTDPLLKPDGFALVPSLIENPITVTRTPTPPTAPDFAG